MADKKNKVEDKSPDFNDEYQQYGLNTFSIRLKDRINSAIKKKKLSAALINELMPRKSIQATNVAWTF